MKVSGSVDKGPGLPEVDADHLYHLLWSIIHQFDFAKFNLTLSDLVEFSKEKMLYITAL